MTIALDHLTIPTRDKAASAKLLGELFGVPWANSAAAAPFAPVYVSDSLTIDFDETSDSFPAQHYAFRVADSEFETILSRIIAAGLSYRGNPHGPNDMKVNSDHGGRIVYWNDPDDHVWEILTVSYACDPNTQGRLEGEKAK